MSTVQYSIAAQQSASSPSALLTVGAAGWQGDLTQSIEALGKQLTQCPLLLSTLNVDSGHRNRGLQHL